MTRVPSSGLEQWSAWSGRARGMLADVVLRLRLPFEAQPRTDSIAATDEPVLRRRAFEMIATSYDLKLPNRAEGTLRMYPESIED